MKKVIFPFTLIICLIFSLESFSQGLEYRKSFNGLASFYGKEFSGRTTANGDMFDPSQFTCAHRYLPFGTLIEVRNPVNNKKVIVKVNDRGPFVDDRVMDLSKAAAGKLGIIGNGVAFIEAKVLKRRKGFDLETGNLLPDFDAILKFKSSDRFYKDCFIDNQVSNLILKR